MVFRYGDSEFEELMIQNLIKKLNPTMIYDDKRGNLDGILLEDFEEGIGLFLHKKMSTTQNILSKSWIKYCSYLHKMGGNF